MCIKKQKTLLSLNRSSSQEWLLFYLHRLQAIVIVTNMSCSKQKTPTCTTFCAKCAPCSHTFPERRAETAVVSPSVSSLRLCSVKADFHKSDRLLVTNVFIPVIRCVSHHRDDSLLIFKKRSVTFFYYSHDGVLIYVQRSQIYHRAHRLSLYRVVAMRPESPAPSRVG